MTSWQDHLPSGDQKQLWRDPSDGKRFVVRADEKLTAFLEPEAAIRAGSKAHPKKVTNHPSSPASPS